MDKNLDIIAKELFGKIRTQFPKIKLGDEESKITDEPEKARFFDFEYTQDGEILGNINISLSKKDGVVVIYSNDLIGDKQSHAKTRFFNFLRELREFAKQKLMNFDTRNITKSNLEKRDYKFLSHNIGEGTMIESKLYGTSMTSYQQLGDTRLVVKHTAPVNSELPAGRTQRINSIYIENSQGERFKYPFKHLNGARALAQHIGHGGTPYDSLGQHVIGLSEEMSKLRMFKSYVDRNPTISENIGGIKDKVFERIEEIKKQIHDLQHPTRYESFAESFEEKEETQIPEEIVNDWIDRLTIRTFNEELKNVFPYIFKLVDESDIPVKELTFDDLIEKTEDMPFDGGKKVTGPRKDEYGNVVKNIAKHLAKKGRTAAEKDSKEKKESSIPEIAEYESQLNRIVGEAADIFSDNPEAAVEKLNQLVSQEFPVGADGTNAIESLNGIINDKELMDIFKELADISPGADVRDILKDYIKMKDEENGTDVLSMITFGEEETGVDYAPEVPAAPAAEPVPAAPAAAPAEQPVTASLEPTDEGNAFAQAVQKAKAAGMKPGDKFKVGEKEFTLQDAIEQAGLKVEDFFGGEPKSNQGELIEFIKSMYDSNTGAFPKGETGVLIAVEKKFGEGALPVAHKVIGKLNNMFEGHRIKKLAGLVK